MRSRRKNTALYIYSIATELRGKLRLIGVGSSVRAFIVVPWLAFSLLSIIGNGLLEFKQNFEEIPFSSCD